MDFLVAFREASWNFPCQDHDFKDFRGFPGTELGIFRVAESSGEGRVVPHVVVVIQMLQGPCETTRRLLDSALYLTSCCN